MRINPYLSCKMCDLRCKNCGGKLAEAEAPSIVAIKCYRCKKLNTYTLTQKDNQTTVEPQSFINNYEKTAVTINRPV